jgi:hypothetical protein
VQDADDVFRRAAPQRNAGEFGIEHGLDDRLRRVVGVDSDHLGAVDHHVRHLQVAEPENVVDVLGLAHFELAVLRRFFD